jgi:hypothetical protein
LGANKKPFSIIAVSTQIAPKRFFALKNVLKIRSLSSAKNVRSGAI